MQHGYDEATHSSYMGDRETAEDNSFSGWYHCQTTVEYTGGINHTQHIVHKVHRKPGNMMSIEPGEIQCITICTVETRVKVNWYISEH